MKNQNKFYFFSFLCFVICIIIFNISSVSASSYDPLFDDFSNFPEFPRTATNYMIIYNSSTTSEGGYFAYFIDDTELFITSDGTITTNIFYGVLRSKLYYDSDGLPYWGSSYTVFSTDRPFYYHNSTQTIIASTVDIKNADGETFFFRNAIVSSRRMENYNESDPPTDVPDYDDWASKIFDSITSWFSGVLESLASPFESIAEGLSGVWQSVKNIPQAIADKLEYLFVPSGDKFDELKDKFDEKFGFVGQIIDLGETIINATFGGSKPNSNITLYGGTYTIIDWDIYDNYRTYIHGIIVLLSYIVFIPKLIKRLPSIIRGI